MGGTDLGRNGISEVSALGLILDFIDVSYRAYLDLGQMAFTADDGSWHQARFGSIWYLLYRLTYL